MKEEEEAEEGGETLPLTLTRLWLRRQRFSRDKQRQPPSFFSLNMGKGTPQAAAKWE